MADNSQQVCEEPRGQPPHAGALSGAALIITMIGRGVAGVYNAITRDGTLTAAFRQGAGEIGQALKALPDSVSYQEPGTILNPTQGEIAEARDIHAPAHDPLPSPVARENAVTVHGPQQPPSPAAPSLVDTAKGQVTVHGVPQGNVQPSPSPGDIAKGNGQVLEQGKTPDMTYGEYIRQQEQAKTPGIGYAEWLELRRKGSQGDNADNDQNEQEKGRSLPEEQKEKQKEEERGRDR